MLENQRYFFFLIVELTLFFCELFVCEVTAFWTAPI